MMSLREHQAKSTARGISFESDGVLSRPSFEAMKTSIASLLILLAAGPSLSLAQAPGQPGQAVEASPRMPRPRQPQGEAPAPVVQFANNMKLTLEGNLLGVLPTNFSVVAGDPVVTLDIPFPHENGRSARGTFQATLTPGSPWTVKVSFGAQVPISTGNNNYEYRDFVLRTTARITPGEKVVLWEQGDQKLTLGLEELQE